MSIKKISTFRLRISEDELTISPESDYKPWWRNELNRQNNAIIVPEILMHIMNIAMNLSYSDKDGKRIGKYDALFITLPPNPKSSQGRQKTPYRKRLEKILANEKEEISKFKGRQVFLYICIFLRKKRFLKYDTDNFSKAIVDSLKPFIGDDNLITSVHIEKVQLPDYPDEDMDFIEQVFLIITVPEAKKDLFG